jgi:hypothetical protein
MPIGMSDALNEKFGMKPAGNDAPPIAVLGANFSPVAEGHVVLVPRDDLSGAVEAGFEEVVASRAIEIVRQVVLPRPQQLDGRAVHLTRNPRGFRHVVVQNAAAEAAAHADESAR